MMYADFRDQIDAEIHDIGLLATSIKGQLKQLGADATDQSKEYTPAERQMRRNLHQQLSKRTKALVDEFIAMRESSAEQHRKTMKRHVHIVFETEINPNTKEPYTDAELQQISEQVIETGASPFLTALAGNALRGTLPVFQC